VPLTAEPLTVRADDISPSQIVKSDSVATEGVGLTVIVNDWAAPVHVFAVGVTIIVAEITVEPVFVTEKAAISPVPSAAKPILVVLFVHEYVVPLTVEPLKVTAVVTAVLHSIWSEGSDTEGVGLTVIVKACGVPAQVFAVGVTDIVAITGVAPLFVTVNGVILPVLLPAKPILGVLLTQLKVVPETAEPPKVSNVVVVLLQLTVEEGTVTEGVGLTVIVNVCGVPEQPFAVGVTIMVAITGVDPVFVVVNAAILPVPLPDNPMLVLSFVQL
jgi:hypothetical protein